jgi:KipI family sensor histidine kinase inhibitor
VARSVDKVRFLPSSDQTLMVRFGEAISLEVHERILGFLRLLEEQPVAGVRNLHPAYCSVLVKFDALRWTHAELEIALREYLERPARLKILKPRVVEIPVCYGGEYGPDLRDIGAADALTMKRVVELHTSSEYLVYFLGFVPGFAYLGRVGKQKRTTGNASAAIAPRLRPALEVLDRPRLATPRRSVPAGSVGTAGGQTGVYPFATPGGWRLIGRTPMKMFSVETGKSVLAIGDRVRFVAISQKQFAELDRV